MDVIDFEAEAIRYFRDSVPAGMMQRIDGIELSRLSEFWFWRWRLDRLVKRGVLSRRSTRSFWRSCDGMPAYGITKND